MDHPAGPLLNKAFDNREAVILEALRDLRKVITQRRAGGCAERCSA
jgi:hypothetical protein